MEQGRGADCALRPGRAHLRVVGGARVSTRRDVASGRTPLPIQYALTYPDRVPSDRVQTNFARLGRLDFEEPDLERFPALQLARRAGEIGGTLPAVLNAANEVAVDAFCNRRLRFDEIPPLVEQTMNRHAVVKHPDLAQILAADAWARQHTGLPVQRAS